MSSQFSQNALSILQDVQHLAQRIEQDMPGYNKKNSSYTDIHGLPVKKQQSLKLKTRDLIKKYGHTLRSTIADADKHYNIYQESTFLEDLRDIHQHFGVSYARMSQYHSAEDALFSAINLEKRRLHIQENTKDIEKSLELYNTLFSLQLEEEKTGKIQQRFLATLQTLVQDAYDRFWESYESHSKEDIALVHAISHRTSLHYKDLIYAMTSIQPSARDFVIHNILCAYIACLADDKETTCRFMETIINKKLSQDQKIVPAPFVQYNKEILTYLKS